MSHPVWPAGHYVSGLFVLPSVRQGSVRPSFCRSCFRGTIFACSAQQKPCLFNKLSCMPCNANMTYMCTSYFLFWPWPPYNLFPRSCLTWIVFVDSHWWIPLWCAAPSKIYAFSPNYHAWITMPTWHRCAPPILFWPWPHYDLLMGSCLTWIFYVDPHWWVPLWVQHPVKAMPFQNIMHVFYCQHDIDVHRTSYFVLTFDCIYLFPRSCLTWILFIDPHWYDFVCITLQKLCHYNKLSCMYCNAHMIYMYTYFVFDL